MVKFKYHKLLNYYVLFACFVTITKMFVLFAYLLGTSVSVITSTIFIGNIVVIYYLQRYIKKRKTVLVFGIFIVVLPVLVSIINLEASITALLLQFYYMSQLLLGAIAVVLYKDQLKQVIIFAVVVNFVAGLVSVINPMLFEPLSVINDTRSFYGGRAIAFFLQPNAFGNASVVLLILSSVLSTRKSFQYLYPILAITTVITFSRSAIGLFVIISAMLLFYKLWQGEIKIKSYITPTLKIFTVGSALIFILLQTPYGKLITDESFNQVQSRIAFFLNFDANTLEEDSSLHHRDHYQQAYISRIDEYFISGNGIGTQSEAMQIGELAGSAHQVHLELIYQGGIFYWMSFLFVLFNVIYIYWMNRNKNPDKALFALQIFMFILIFSFLSSGMLHMRELYLAMGLLIQFDLKNNFIER